MCCWTGISVRKLYFSAKFLNVDHALVYDDEVDAVTLESRSLFTNRVNLDKAEDWESRLVVCRPNVLIVEIAVPWNEKARHIVYFLLMLNVLH